MYSVPVIVSTTYKQQKQLVLSYYMCPEMLLFPLRIIFSSFLLGYDEVLSDESQAPHPPTLFSHAFGIADLVL